MISYTIPEPFLQQLFYLPFAKLGQDADDNQFQDRIPKVPVQISVPPDIQLALDLLDPGVRVVLAAEEAPTHRRRQEGEQGERAGAFDVADFAGGRGWRGGRREAGVGENGLAEGA